MVIRRIFSQWRPLSGGRVVLLMVSVALAAGMACAAILLSSGTEPAEAAFPGKNGRIAFTKSTEGGPWIGVPQIYSMKPDGGAREQLTFNKDGSNDPNWSPGGRKIAFSRGKGDQSDIYTMNADGTHKVRLTSSKKVERSPAWAPDGRKLVFARAASSGSYDLFTVNLDGSNLRRLTTTASSERDPAWSPDGEKIAFTAGKAIYVMKADGSQAPSELVAPSDYNYWYLNSLDWSPNGRWLVFDATARRDKSIFKVKADGTRLTRLVGSSYLYSKSFYPAWSPNGAKIVYSFGNKGILKKMNADGTGRKAIEGPAGEPRRGRSSSWQPLN